MEASKPTQPSAPPAEDLPYAVAVPIAAQVGTTAIDPRQPPTAAVPTGDKEIVVGRWGVDLCGCFTHCVPNCLMVTFCPCVSVAQISSKLGVLSYWGVLGIYLVLVIAEGVAFGFIAKKVVDDDWTATWDYSGSSSGSSDLKHDVGYHVFRIVSTAVEALIVLFVWQLRTKTRERFQIPGSCCQDFCISLWCSCCAIAQLATHVKSYKPGSCEFGAPRDTLPAYR
ncbi:hypothetical protein BBJ28_00024265 [Nothophytophthora sp. Chile5]|nr:hypothetical protein BBJ28_00024265 [Nothophytophthora sp. Chile5]